MTETDAKQGLSLLHKAGIGLAVVALIVSAGAWYLYGSCGTVAVANSTKEMATLLGKWQDATTLASSTPRMSLPAQITRLQEIRTDTSAMEVPLCLLGAQSLLLKSMDYAIDGFMAFLGQKADSTVSGYFASAANVIRQYTEEVTRVKQCAPFCAATLP